MQLMAVEKSELFSLREIGEILGSISEGDPGFHQIPIMGVSTDSRTIKKSELFVTLKGDNFDGHDFLETAFANGAAAAIVERKETARRNLSGPRFIIVDYPLYSLGELAKYHRKKMNARIVAVTGSNGKTTVKNLIYEIMACHGPALKSEGNLNNLIGLPQSIFRLNHEHKAAVFELGMSLPGEIDRLGEIVQPQVGVITNIGPVHLETMKSIDEVAAAKLELMARILPGGTLIINGDDPILKKNLAKTSLRIFRFGMAKGLDLNPENIEYDHNQFVKFSIAGHPISLQLPGIHNLCNALAALSVAVSLGYDLKRSAEAISNYSPEGMRSELIEVGGIKLYIDCYNANPVSMKSAIDTLSSIETKGRKIAVLADMLELGKDSLNYHKEIGKHLKNTGIEMVLAYGPLSKAIIDEFGPGGSHFDDKNLLIDRIHKLSKKNDVILFKGSRGMKLEDVVMELKKRLG